MNSTVRLSVFLVELLNVQSQRWLYLTSAFGIGWSVPTPKLLI